MLVTANLLSKGIKIIVGRNQYEIMEVNQAPGLTRVSYKNAKGVLRSKTYNANDKVNIR